MINIEKQRFEAAYSHHNQDVTLNGYWHSTAKDDINTTGCIHVTASVTLLSDQSKTGEFQFEITDTSGELKMAHAHQMAGLTFLDNSFLKTYIENFIILKYKALIK